MIRTRPRLIVLNQWNSMLFNTYSISTYTSSTIKDLHVDNPNSNSIALSISTDPTESSIADLLIIKCETTKEYNKSVREIIKSWLKRIETDYYVILCLTGFGMRTKKSASLYRTMSKDFACEAAGDSTRSCECKSFVTTDMCC